MQCTCIGQTTSL